MLDELIRLALEARNQNDPNRGNQNDPTPPRLNTPPTFAWENEGPSDIAEPVLRGNNQGIIDLPPEQEEFCGLKPIIDAIKTEKEKSKSESVATHPWIPAPKWNHNTRTSPWIYEKDAKYYYHVTSKNQYNPRLDEPAPECYENSGVFFGRDYGCATRSSPVNCITYESAFIHVRYGDRSEPKLSLRTFRELVSRGICDTSLTICGNNPLLIDSTNYLDWTNFLADVQYLYICNHVLIYKF